MPGRRLTRQEGTRQGGAGIVHLGLGAFFRAHGAIWIEEAMAARGGDWRIVGVSLQRPDQRDALAPQGFAYSALEIGPDAPGIRVVEVLDDVLVAREDPEAVLAAMADPAIAIVTLTVTEKGYCHEPATGALDLSHPDIVHDISEAMPVTAPGFIVRALERRRRAGLRPFTVLSCDNLPDNGRVTRGVTLALARRIDPGLAAWIEAEGRFPSSMVDRIVPAITPEDIALIEARWGFRDASPVKHEPFRQWVIEDDFVDGRRPALEAVGVRMVADVAPYESVKLRMLNGTHSALAYLGYLAGHETIADTVRDPVFDAYVRRLWQREIIPAVDAPEGMEPGGYAAALLERYRNPGIRHRTWQIAMDGSQKLPQRILGTIADDAAGGRDFAGLALAVAGWMRYVGGVDERGGAIDVRDPLAARLRRLVDAAEGPRERVGALLGVAEVFPPALVPALAGPVTRAYERIAEVGARAAAGEVAGARA